MTFEWGSDRHRRGMKAEQDFFKLMQRRGAEITYSTRKEDQKDHIDFHIDGDMRVDVKGVKRVLGKYTDKWTWVEVDGEHTTGWLWAPKVTHFAFKQTTGNFLLIKKEDLQEIANTHYKDAVKVTSDVEQIVDNPRLYCYRRGHGLNLPAMNKERVLLVKTSLIRGKAQLLS